MGWRYDRDNFASPESKSRNHKGLLVVLQGSNREKIAKIAKIAKNRRN